MNARIDAPPPTEQTMAASTNPSTDSFRRYGRILILAGLAVLLLWLAFKAVRIVLAAQSLLSLQEDATALLDGGLSNLDTEAVIALTERARSDVRTLNQELAPLAPLGALFGWVPRVGPLLEAAPPLLAMADAGSEAASLVVGSLGPGLDVIAREGLNLASIGAILPVITDAGAELPAAAAAMDRYASARAELDATVPLDALPWRAQQLLNQVDEITPLAQGGLTILPALPTILGSDGPRNYLIMAQNEDELRPTGGFLTGAGLLTVENGEIVSLAFQDANQVDNWRGKPYGFPPEPLNTFMLSELFLFRDANYWPDFPTSAQVAMELYAYGQDVPPLDGAIAIDQEFLRLLVSATGPIPIPGSQATINQDNLIQTLRQARDLQEGQEVIDWVNNRKAFLAGFADAILTKVETDLGSVDPINLARAMTTALEGGHLQIYIPDQDVAPLLAQTGWDSRLPQAPPGDYWLVTDTNVGFNKANVYVDRAFDYSVQLGDAPEANLTVTYQHSGPDQGESCYQGVEQEFEEGADYLALADKCYWNYVRFYVPVGSQLLESTRHLVPAETLFNATTWESTAQPIDEGAGLSTFANLLLVPVAGQVESMLRYQLPPGIVTDLGGSNYYQLDIGKQPGTRPERVTVTVTLPPGAQLLGTTPRPSSNTDGQLTFELLLEAPTSIAVRYR